MTKTIKFTTLDTQHNMKDNKMSNLIRKRRKPTRKPEPLHSTMLYDCKWTQKAKRLFKLQGHIRINQLLLTQTEINYFESVVGEINNVYAHQFFLQGYITVDNVRSNPLAYLNK